MKNNIYIILIIVFMVIFIISGCSWFTLSHSNPLDPEYEDPYTGTATPVPTSTPAPTAVPEIQILQGSTIMVSHGGDPYNFGYVTYGNISSPVVFTIKNIGGGILQITELDSNISTDWWLINGEDPNPSGITVDYTLAAGETTTFTVSFQPDRTNFDYSGYILIWYNGSSFWMPVEGHSP